MPRSSPYPIELSDGERVALESLARSYTLPYWQVTRAQMVLLAAQGLRNDQIAVRLTSGPEFGSPGRGFARLNLGTLRAPICEAVDRMARSCSSRPA